MLFALDRPKRESFESHTRNFIDDYQEFNLYINIGEVPFCLFPLFLDKILQNIPLTSKNTQDVKTTMDILTHWIKCTDNSFVIFSLMLEMLSSIHEYIHCSFTWYFTKLHAMIEIILYALGTNWISGTSVNEKVLDNGTTHVGRTRQFPLISNSIALATGLSLQLFIF